MSRWISCPMCNDFKSQSEYAIQVHVETSHPDDPSVEFTTRQPNSADHFDAVRYYEANQYHGYMPTPNPQIRDSIVNQRTQDGDDGSEDESQLDYEICPRPDCGEPVLSEDWETHAEIHASTDDVDEGNIGHGHKHMEEGFNIEQAKNSQNRAGEKGRSRANGNDHPYQHDSSSRNLLSEEDHYSTPSLAQNNRDLHPAEDKGVPMCDWAYGQDAEYYGTTRILGENHDGYQKRYHERRRTPPLSAPMVHQGHGHSHKPESNPRSNFPASSSSNTNSRVSDFAKALYGSRHLPNHRDNLSRSDRTSPSPNFVSDDPSTFSSGSKRFRQKGTTQPKARYGGYGLSSEGHRSASLVSAIRKKRFKISELGPYANEKRMPQWLVDHLLTEGKEIRSQHIDRNGKLVVHRSISNETQGLVPTIGMLCERDPYVERVWLCHPAVKHATKETHHAGGFCGYRNIQMMISFCQVVEVEGIHSFVGEKIPNIIQLQTWIEEGWDQGFNPHARVETGGVKYTRKYIGSSEAQTLFSRLGISTSPLAFNGPRAQRDLLASVLEYFKRDGFDLPGKIIQTQKPPLYLQYPGHSITIIGVEELKDTSVNLLVLDPMFKPTMDMKYLTGNPKQNRRLNVKKLLGPHRRELKHLKRHRMFETLELVPKPAFQVPVVSD